MTGVVTMAVVTIMTIMAGVVTMLTLAMPTLVLLIHPAIGVNMSMPFVAILFCFTGMVFMLLRLVQIIFKVIRVCISFSLFYFSLAHFSIFPGVIQPDWIG